MNKTFPRVLIVLMSRINKADGHGVSIRNWFAEWPMENLAQIYSGGENSSGPFCGAYYRLGPKDRRWGKVFFRLKSSSIGDCAVSKPIEAAAIKNHRRTKKIAVLNRSLGKFLVSSGVWEVLFTPSLSSELVRWIYDFKPDVIYAQGYSLTFSRLPVLLHRRFKIPMCFQTGDDWPSNWYRRSVMAPVMRPAVKKAAWHLISSSAVCLSNGVRMSREYLRRYGIDFTPIMMCDETKRFRRATPKRLVDRKTTWIVCSGSFGSDRWRLLIDIDNACRQLDEEGLRVRVSSFVSDIPSEALPFLRGLSCVELQAPPVHEELPCYFKAADILFLAESFNELEARFIRLSISTKAHLYMMSERPILVYGHSNTGVVDYAEALGWGLTVKSRSVKLLSEAIKRLIFDSSLREKLVKQGIKAVHENHDASKTREKFRLALLKAGQQ